MSSCYLRHHHRRCDCGRERGHQGGADRSGEPATPRPHIHTRVPVTVNVDVAIAQWYWETTTTTVTVTVTAATTERATPATATATAAATATAHQSFLLGDPRLPQACRDAAAGPVARGRTVRPCVHSLYFLYRNITITINITTVTQPTYG